MSLDQLFESRMKDKAGVWDVEQLEKRVAALENEVSELRKGPVYDKEFYTAQDYGPMMHLSPATVTQNYFRTQRIKATKKKGCKSWVTTAEEFRRVESIVRTRGLWALAA